ncbi:protein FAM98B-like [Helianthus annuus]|uniref:protein FAM98B-like n=1 Tax=Helianthus annuus TaxID=4232 RepID=UPI000B8EF44B|nr:protein FAM98B-like [Helianthus annuus]
MSEIRSTLKAAQAAAVAAQAVAEKVAAQTAADKAAATVAPELKAKFEAGIITMTLSGSKPEDLKRFQVTQGKSTSAEIVSGVSWASATASLNFIANKIPSWIRRKPPPVPKVSKEKPNWVKTNGGAVGGNDGSGGAKENGNCGAGGGKEGGTGGAVSGNGGEGGVNGGGE